MALTINFLQQSLRDVDADVRIACIFADQQMPALLVERYPLLAQLAQSREFKGGRGSILTLPVAGDNKISHLVVVGLGKKKDATYCVESLRRAVAAAVRYAQQVKAKSLALELPDQQDLGSDLATLAHEAIIAAGLTAYEFDAYLAQARKINQDFVLSLVSLPQDTALQAEVERALVTVKALNNARQWVNMPPCDLYPEVLACYAQELAAECGLSCRVFSKEEMLRMGMGGITAVGSGSVREPKLAILEYKTSRPNAATLAFVGKGITFDSGGLSLKPAQSMEDMKDDMSGAAAVISAMRVVAYLKPEVNIVALAPMAENLPSGSSDKPSDIIRFYNGVTAEIKNTDAEGRLVLADALAYAVKEYKPAAIIDVATLTGACVVALGSFNTGLFSEHEELVQKITEAARKGFDPVWRLPLNEDYAKANDGDISDICNLGKGNYRAGATNGAAFLQHFVGDVPWAHLDIAGTSFDVPAIPYFRPRTATASGLRILVEFVRLYAKG